MFGLETKTSLEEAEVEQSYELTRDNMLKMMAIWMRFKCGIPVIIMGETGSGKTRLVKFMCSLLKRDYEKDAENFYILKMHGGITDEDVFAIVRKGIKQAKSNKVKGINTTVIFFDEANTSGKKPWQLYFSNSSRAFVSLDSFFAIKTVLCDNLVDGENIPENIGLQFVSAVNPYREHSIEMINKLENAGKTRSS